MQQGERLWEVVVYVAAAGATLDRRYAALALGADGAPLPLPPAVGPSPNFVRERMETRVLAERARARDPSRPNPASTPRSEKRRRGGPNGKWA